MNEDTVTLRLLNIRRKHLDFPCGPWSKEDECFLLSQVADRESQIAVLKAESLQDALTEAIEELKAVTAVRDDLQTQLASLQDEMSVAAEECARLRTISEEAFNVGRDKGLTEAADIVRKLADDLQPKE